MCILNLLLHILVVYLDHIECIVILLLYEQLHYIFIYEGKLIDSISLHASSIYV
jgi:hypothetical protein